MTISPEVLDAYHRQRAEAGDPVVFPSYLSFVWTSFVLSVVQSALNAAVFLVLTFSATFLLLQLIVDALHGDTSLLRPTFIPFALFSDFLFSFVLLFFLSRDPRIVQGRWLSKPAYFRLRIVGLHRLLSSSPYHRMRYHLWYQQRQLTSLCVLDTLASLLVYLPATLTTTALANAAPPHSPIQFFMRAATAVCLLAFIVAQLTLLHCALQWAADRCGGGLGGVGGGKGEERLLEGMGGEGEEGLGQPLPQDRVEFGRVEPVGRAGGGGRGWEDDGGGEVSVYASHVSFEERNSQGLSLSRGSEEERLEELSRGSSRSEAASVGRGIGVEE